jgi:hypothetical protein
MNELSDQKIDELLRRDFAGAVADGGFSARVIRALPPRRRRRPWLLPVAALIGGLLASLALLPSPLLQQAATEWLAADIGAAFVVVCVLLFGVSLLGCGWALEEAA